MTEADNSEQILRAKLEETKGKARLAKLRKNSIDEQIRRPVPLIQLDKVVTELVRSAEFNSVLVTDCLWVLALVEEGVDAQTLLRIWETKDKKSQENKDGVL